MSASDSEAATGLKVLEAGPDAAGARLDQWLAAALGADFSRNRVQALIRQGAVSVGGNVVSEAKRKVWCATPVVSRIRRPSNWARRG